MSKCLLTRHPTLIALNVPGSALLGSSRLLVCVDLSVCVSERVKVRQLKSTLSNEDLEKCCMSAVNLTLNQH